MGVNGFVRRFARMSCGLRTPTKTAVFWVEMVGSARTFQKQCEPPLKNGGFLRTSHVRTSAPLIGVGRLCGPYQGPV